MRVLFVATRSPWPSIDGGRVLMARTIDGLLARGHAVSLVAPSPEPGTTLPPASPSLRLRFVPIRRRGWPESVLRSQLTRRPATVQRHVQPALAREVEARLDEGVDVVHVQQLHALVHARDAMRRGTPIVLRAENVESDLWRQTFARRWGRLAASWSARPLARWEQDALARVTRTAAVSARDAAALRRLAPQAAIDAVPIPMPAALPAGARRAGDPAIVLMASAWRPNRDGAAWFVRDVWPAVAPALPSARLHVFGPPATRARAPGVECHPSPAESMDAFPEGAIAVVPLRIASGANVRILEAWARGLPVVTTPIAAAGVDPGGGTALAIASTAGEFVAAFRRLAEPVARARAIEAGRAALAARHDPAAVAVDLERVYLSAIRAAAGAGA